MVSNWNGEEQGFGVDFSFLCLIEWLTSCNSPEIRSSFASDLWWQFIFTTNTLSFAVFQFLSLFSLVFHSARLMHIKRPALKENSWNMKVSVDPSNPLMKRFANGIFYTEEEVWVSQHTWRVFNMTSCSFCFRFAPSPIPQLSACSGEFNSSAFRPFFHGLPRPWEKEYYGM